MDSDPESYPASRCVRLLSRFQGERITKLLLLIALSDVPYSTEITHHLYKRGDEVLRQLLPWTEETTKEDLPAILSIVPALPFPDVAKFVHNHFSQLYKTDRLPLMETLFCFGMKEFLPLVKSKMKNEGPEEEVYVLLCRRHNIKDFELKRTEKFLSQQEQRIREGFDRISATDMDDLPFPEEDDFEEHFTPVVHQSKIGRNDPCPCGSGKKYKKCCIDKQTSQPATMKTEDESRLIERLIHYSQNNVFHREYKKAVAIFFSKSIEDLNEIKKNPNLYGRFLEWYIHDFVLTSGTTIIREFYKNYSAILPSSEKELLQDWIERHLSWYEVVDCIPEKAEIRLKDLFTAEECLIRDVSASRGLVKWDLIAGRVVKVGDHLRLLGSLVIVPPNKRDVVLEFFNERWNEYKQETGDESWKSFMSAEGYLIQDFAQQMKAAPLPELFTPEGHPVLFCKAHFQLEDMEKVQHRLKEHEDFLCTSADYPIQFIWVDRGKLENLIPNVKREKSGLIIHGELINKTEAEGIRTLGSITLRKDGLILETISRARLDAGKRRLEEICGKLIRFRIDVLQDVDNVMKEKRSEKNEIDVPEANEVMMKVLAKKMENWLHESIPALDGKTPLEMVKTAEGKERVETLIKEFENKEERKRRKGQPFVDVNILRERLGLTK
ncbi:SEC-C domain-containing protein [bacterium]|nr:SEC-C domain-containing protein [bacterium]